MQTKLLLIYTGGTIGMINDPKSGSLKPFSLEDLISHVPEIKLFNYTLDSYTFDPLIDSSDIQPEMWIKMSQIIKEKYEQYDGFIILHGTDTMSFSASALSFMLNNLNKPVVLTGSQLPIGKLRTDGKENLITAIEIAASKTNGNATIPEVCVVFENRVFRGNRTTKFNSEEFNAFYSFNYPELAKIGIQIHYNKNQIAENSDDNFFINTKLDNNIALLKLFPGISQNVVDSILNINNLRGIIIETYGAGNAPTASWFINSISKAIEKGLIVLNVTQCKAGSVEMGLYETSLELLNKGVVSGHDITIEAAVTKFMHVLGQSNNIEEVKKLLNDSLKGEITK